MLGLFRSPPGVEVSPDDAQAALARNEIEREPVPQFDEQALLDLLDDAETKRARTLRLEQQLNEAGRQRQQREQQLASAESNAAALANDRTAARDAQRARKLYERSAEAFDAIHSRVESARRDSMQATALASRCEEWARKVCDWRPIGEEPARAVDGDVIRDDSPAHGRPVSTNPFQGA